MKRRLAPLAVALTLALPTALTACSGDDPGDAGSASSAPDGDAGGTTTTAGAGSGAGAGGAGGTTTTEAPSGDEQAEVPLAAPDLGHRFVTTVGRQVARGEVRSATVYRIVTKANSVQFEILVLDDLAFTRTGGETTLPTARFVPDDPELVGIPGQIELLAEALDDGILANPATAARQLAANIAAIEPVRAVETLLEGDHVVAEVEAGIRIRGRLDVESLAGRTLDGVASPLFEATLDADGNPLRLRFPSGDEPAPTIDIEITGYGNPPDLEPPPPELIDRTPTVGEEGLLAFADAPIVVPVPVPAGLELVGTRVLSPEETFEDCNQVMVNYAAPAGSFLDVFVLDTDCAVAFDPTPFDLVVGGHPARAVHLLELRVGDAVVQFDTDLSPAQIEQIAATLRPVTAEELIAMVTPS